MELAQVKVESLVNEENILFQEKFATVYYSAELRVLGVRWHGSFKEQEYVGLFNKMIEDMQGKAVVGFYSDIREQGVVPVGARKEFEKTFSPKGKEMGIDKTGVVTDASPFKKYYLNTIIKITGRPVKLTSQPEEALQFILEGKL